jgi:hypothetical protein
MQATNVIMIMQHKVTETATKLMACVADLLQQRIVMRGALEFYATPENWVGGKNSKVGMDGGALARACIVDIEGPPEEEAATESASAS